MTVQDYCSLSNLFCKSLCFTPPPKSYLDPEPYILGSDGLKHGRAGERAAPWKTTSTCPSWAQEASCRPFASSLKVSHFGINKDLRFRIRNV